MSIPYLNLYESDIKSTISYCDNILFEFDIDRDNFDKHVYEYLNECGNWENPTASYQTAYMEATITYLQDKYPNEEFEYDVNGVCNQITVNGEVFVEGSPKGKYIKDFSITTELDMVEVSYGEFKKLDSLIHNEIMDNIPLEFKEKYIIEVNPEWEFFMEEAMEANYEADLDEAYERFTSIEEENASAVFIITDPYNDDFKKNITIDKLFKDVTDLSDENAISKISENMISEINDKEHTKEENESREGK